MDQLNLHPDIRARTANRALGTIVGSALGDAIGLYTEFLPKTACHAAYPASKFSLLPENITKFREDSHRDKFEPGDWTDDTDQSLLILLSYLHSFQNDQTRGNVERNAVPLAVDLQDFAIRINSWLTQGLRALKRPPLGIGQTIGRVVLDPDYLSNPAEAALKIWIKSKRNAAANGSLMRTHPIGVICFDLTEEESFELSAQVGRTTHVDPRCVVACCVQVGLVRGILRGEVDNEDKMNDVINRAWDWVESKDAYKDPEFLVKQQEQEKADAEVEPSGEAEGEWQEVHEKPAEKVPVVATSPLSKEEFRKHCFAESFEELQLDDSQKMGYVYKCLATALLCLRKAMRREKESLLPTNSDLFENLISELVMEGGDADTNACVAGALLGAWLGYDHLPSHWERGIHNREWLLKKSQSLLYRVGILEDVNGKYQTMVERDRDTALDGGKGFLTKEELDRRERDFVFMVLTKQKERREEAEREEQAKKSGLSKWFKTGK